MADEIRYDDPEMQKFYEENREKIEMILQDEKERARIAEEARIRAYFDELQARKEEEIRMYEELRKAREAEEQEKENVEAPADDGEPDKDITDKVIERIEKERARAAKMEAYAHQVYLEERERARARFEEHKESTRATVDEYMGRYKTERDERKEKASQDYDHMREKVSEGLDRTFGFVNDPQLQQHVVGTGLEMWMALNALVKAGPFPDFMKDALSTADKNKNVEYCRKNQYCRSKKNPDAPRYREGGETYKEETEGPKPVTIVPIQVKKEE